ncbi:zinc finger protein 436 [Oryzias melastigma]|nr:zinc finger protein 436 [Oryzias melastigma]
MEAHGAGRHVVMATRQDVRVREVGCQWESPVEQQREAGCQSEPTPTAEAGVQVDLLGEPACSGQSDLSALLLSCHPADCSPVLQHSSTNRTRTRTVRPAVRLLAEPVQTRAKVRKRLVPQSSDSAELSQPSQRRHRRATEVPQEEEDIGDPLWTPSEGGVDSVSSGGDVIQPDSLHGSLQVVKQELDSTVCDVCGKVMKNKSSLARHSFIHTGKKPFSCHLCELRFNRRDNLQHHLSRLHPDGVAKLEKQRSATAWLCAVCGKTFSCRSRLQTHEVIHSGMKPHRCDLCPKAYMRTNDLEHHKKVVHSDTTSKPQKPSSLLCHLCGKEFKCRSQLAVHFQTHSGERPHLCDICGRKFSRQYQLRRHKVLVHTGLGNGEENVPPDAAYTCSVCGKRLKTEALLLAHTRIHSGDKPHRCNACPRSFQRVAFLRQHHARVHLRVRASEVQPAARRRRSIAESDSFPCPVCGKVFRFRSLLASHALIHSDVRPFDCDICSRSFRRLSHLKRHREVVHDNGARLPESFICHICGVDKKCRSQLARHVIIHTGERPFTCDLCPARFNRRGNLQQHKRRMHGTEQPTAQDVPAILFDEEHGLACREEEAVHTPDGTGGFEDATNIELLDAT